MVAPSNAAVRPVASTATFGILIFFRLTVLIKEILQRIPASVNGILCRLYSNSPAAGHQGSLFVSLVIPFSTLARIFGGCREKRPCTPLGREPACLDSEISPSPHVHREDTPTTYSPAKVALTNEV